ncbi:HK97-gp10 family putative phage morphogenesis protein [Moraxella sp. ZY200743]|uniref:HK97-gp10 family putative phage morphogenesis protein n=1 Tax=Moraxella sp. ZY200743 TaxID=2911970 RepID=UPI003D7EE677
MQINGLDELNNKLKALRDELGNKDAGKVLYSSLMFASTPMYKAVRAKAPVSPSMYRRYMSGGQGDGYYFDKNGKKRRRRAKRGTGKYQMQAPGLYKKSIKRRRLTRGVSANIDGAAIAIYVSEGTGKTYGSAYYWYFNEFGTSSQAPRPIFRPTFDGGYANAEVRFAQKLGERIDKIMG